MKTLYLECSMGAAGDMLAAALLELHPHPEEFLKRFQALGIPGVEVSAQPTVKCGITGTHVSVKVHGVEEESLDVCHHHHDQEPGHEHHHQEHSHEHDHHHHGNGPHHHTGMGEIRHIFSHLELPQQVRKDAEAVYQLIAQAESRAHGKPVEEVHFHEVGAMDAVADVTMVCLLLHELQPEQILASPVHVGSGRVRCAHGILPIPAPATAHILQDVPIYGGGVKGELCTPTGAALLKHFVQGFGEAPVMRTEKIGYGMGTKDFQEANCLRAFWGETEGHKEQVAELSCNLDDMTPEALGFAQERLWEAGALDVSTMAVGMKKNRPGVVLTCLCREKDREKVLSALFAHTTTLGVRETLCRRYTLERAQKSVETKYGPVRVKTASGWGVCREKAEYEDLAKIAREQNLTLEQIKKLL